MASRADKLCEIQNRNFRICRFLTAYSAIISNRLTLLLLGEFALRLVDSAEGFFDTITQKLHKCLSGRSFIRFYEVTKNFYNLLKEKAGGSVWESNPPSRVLAPITGFEVQAAHQHRYASAEENQRLKGRLFFARSSLSVYCPCFWKYSCA